MTIVSSDTLHASCVAIGGHAVLIEGRSGSGKSDLALRLIDRGATLVSDDYTIVRRDDGRLLASAPANIAGRIEARGLGIITMAHVGDVPVALAVRTDAPVERMPEANRIVIVGCTIPLMAIAPFEASAPFKIERALAQRAGGQ